LREREATHQKETDWVEERKRLSKREKEREREKRKDQVSRSQIGRGWVASLVSRISCRRRKPPAQILVANF